MNNRLPSVDLLEQERSAPLGLGGGTNLVCAGRSGRSPLCGAPVAWRGGDLSTPTTLAGFPVLSLALSLIGVQAPRGRLARVRGGLGGCAPVIARPLYGSLAGRAIPIAGLELG